MAGEERPQENTASVEVLARLLNLTPRRVQQLAKDGHIPRPVQGRYSVVPCVQGYCRYMQNALAGKHDSEKLTYDTRLAKEKAEKAARENQVARGELIPKQDVVAGVQAALAHARARILAVPSKAAPAVIILDSPAEVKEALTDYLHDALDELSRTRFVSVSEGEGGPDDGAGADGRAKRPKAPAKANRKRVGRSKPDAKSGKQRRTRKVGNRKS